MNALQRYHAENLPELMDKISKHGIGMDDYLDRFFNSDFPQSNYPPYNLIQLNNHESTLEIALAGFKKDQLQVFTEFGKLHVQGEKETTEVDRTFIHKGLAQRSFKRVWEISDDTKVGSVKFEDGLLTVQLNKIVPEHHARTNYLGKQS